MNISKILALLADLVALERIMQEAATPDGRWNLLQNWLRENPKWSEQVEQWASMQPDQALNEVCEFVARKANIPTLLKQFITPELETRIKTAIETLQECYRERQTNNQNGRQNNG